MTETNTQISVYDALLKDEPDILASVKLATNRLLTHSLGFVSKRASVDYMKALNAFMDKLGFPEADGVGYVFLNMSDLNLDHILGSRSTRFSLLDLLSDLSRDYVRATLHRLAVTGAQIAGYYPRCTFALALADLEADLNRVPR